jgi:sugar lactone lactonase YvrE
MHTAKTRRFASGRVSFVGLATVVAMVMITAVASIAVGSQARASGHVEVVTSFDRTNGELPEGIIIDKVGNIFVTMGIPFFVGGGYGAVWQISPDGTETAVLAEYPDGPAPAGIAVDAPGNVYFALVNPFPSPEAPTPSGIYRFADDGSTERLPGTEHMFLPNGLALDKHGNLFVGESLDGAIWRVPTDGSADAAIWLQDEYTRGCPGDFGANGVALWKSNLYVANTSKGLLARIPILKDGSPGTPELVAGNLDCGEDELFGMDGIALDVHGNIYALLVLQNKLVRIDPTDGTVTTLLNEDDGLWNPASLAFGTGKGDRKSIYIANFAVLPPEPANSLGAAVLKFDVGVPGLPLP